MGREHRPSSGIEGLDIQDTAITESMGPVVDHEDETLVASDVLVARVRRRMMAAIEALRDHGTAPPGLDQPETYRDAWSGYVVAPAEMDWLDVFARNIPQNAEWAAA